MEEDGTYLDVNTVCQDELSWNVIQIVSKCCYQSKQDPRSWAVDARRKFLDDRENEINT